MNRFGYYDPTSVQKAVGIAEDKREARYLAGGQSLLPTMRLRLDAPTDLIDLGQIADLRGIKVEGNAILVGAMVSHAEVCASRDIGARIPALAHLASQIGDRQVRNRGTLGGSVANNDPAADYPAAVLALNATIVTTRREIAAADYFQGMFATALEEGEIIVRLIMPLPKRAAYCKFPHPASGYAMAGAFVAETADGVRVAVTGAGPGVFRWQEAESALGKSMSAAALDALSLDAGDMNEDIHATREYRANLAKVMTKRAVEKLVAGRT